MRCGECKSTSFELLHGGFICSRCETLLAEQTKPKEKKHKPLYRTLTGLTWRTNSSVNKVDCCVVITPHFREQWDMRFPQISKETMLELCKRVIELSNHGAFNGTPIRDLDNKIIAFIYNKKIFNIKRKRWELELVSITPPRIFQTENGPQATWLDTEE